MKRALIAMLTLAAFSGAVVAQTEVEKALAKAAQVGNASLAVVEVSIESPLGSTKIGGPAVCIAVDEATGKATFMSNAVDNRLEPENVKGIEMIVPGADRKAVKATLMGIDSETGMSFFAAEGGHKWSAVAIAPSSNLKSGQMVTSVGIIPGDPSNAVYVGVGYISATLRTPAMMAYVTGGKLTSGGSPVFDASGQVIGLVGRQAFLEYQITLAGGRATAAALQGRQESSFFTPVEEFVHVMQRIPSDGKVRRLPWVGILGLQGVDEVLAKTVKLETTGVAVDRVVPETPAAKAGLQDRDIITAVNGQPIEKLANPQMTAENVLRQIARMPVGSELKVTYVRPVENAQPTTGTATMTIEPMPQRPDEARRFLSTQLGLMVREKVDLDQYIDSSPTAKVAGLLVLELDPRGAAAQAGLRQGDVITSANLQSLKTVDKLKEIVDKSIEATPPQSIDLGIRRENESRTVTIQPPPKPR